MKMSLEWSELFVSLKFEEMTSEADLVTVNHNNVSG